MIRTNTLYKAIKRKTPWGGVLQWNIALNNLLIKLDILGFKAVDYNDDVALAI